MTRQEREMMIEVLLMKTGYSRNYFEKLSDTKLEYDYLSQLDDDIRFQ